MKRGGAEKVTEKEELQKKRRRDNVDRKRKEMYMEEMWMEKYEEMWSEKYEEKCKWESRRKCGMRKRSKGGITSGTKCDRQRMRLEEME